ncbi:MAG: inositol monophosphatase [Actinomycetota bacterium]|nr:inositol monophosphatase [Actinomycetota bacterium]
MTIGSPSPEHLLDIASRAATGAGGLLLERFGDPARGVTTKSTPTDVVSDADRDSQELIVSLLRSERPGDGVVSEEGAAGDSETGLTWVIDPLDGTVDFLYGIPQWCVSVAVADDDGWLAGVIYDPPRKELFTATRGGGASRNEQSATLSQQQDLSQALVATGFSYDSRIRRAQAEVVLRLLPEVRDIRRAGSAALDLAWCACGRVDAFFEADMHVWDRAAGELLISEAGGVITPLMPPLGDGQGVVAANQGLHDALRALVLGDNL